MNSSYLQAIKSFEGFTRTAKWDYAQYSNGYGTKAKYEGEVIDEAEAERRFAAELSQSLALVDKFAPGLDEGTKAALVSLTFNAGTGWMKSGLGNAVAAGDLQAVRERFVMYDKAGGAVLPGLAKRRAAEAEWIGGGATAHNPPAEGLVPLSALVPRRELAGDARGPREHPPAASETVPSLATQGLVGGAATRDDKLDAYNQEKLLIQIIAHHQLKWLATSRV